MVPRLSAPKLPYHLLRRFALVSFAIIAGIATVNALLITSFLTRRIIDREAQVTMEFVQNVLTADGSIGYLAAQEDARLGELFRGSLIHLTSMPDVLRANVYTRDGIMLWSSNPGLIGRQFTDNHELVAALGGRLMVLSGRITPELREKREQIGLPPNSEFFIETYIPVRDPATQRILGAVEIYKAASELPAAISAGHRQVWATALAGGLVLYLALFWIVLRADRIIRQQHERLIEAETLVVVGELASSVAHNIRNPLASIRSSAELAVEMKGENCETQARDIIAAADRIDNWVRELLHFTHSDPEAQVPLDAAALLSKCFDDTAHEMENRGIKAEVVNEAPGASVVADTALLGHVIHSLLANAMDATSTGGRIEGRIARSAPGRISISIRDTGHGVDATRRGHIFRPFYTTKPQGLGLGLSLVRRAMERFGGTVRVDGTPGGGATFTLELPAA